MKRLGLLVLIGYTASAGVAQAATYYVAKSGNNGNTCAQAQSISTPKLTIGEGLNCLAAGDTLFVRGGNYDEGISNNIPSGTSWSNKVRVANYNGETVWLKPLVNRVNNNGFVFWLSGARSYIELDGINLDSTSMPYSAIKLDGPLPHHIRIRNVTVTAGSNGSFSEITIDGADHELINITVSGGGQAWFCGVACSHYGFYIVGDRILLDGCDVSDASGGGIHIYNGSGSADNNIVRNCRIHDITRSGDTRIFGILVSGNNNQVYNNLIYGIKFSGSSGNAALIVYTGSGNKIWNNTVANNTINGIKTDPGASNTEVRNNIAYGNTGSGFANAGTGTTESNNLFGVDPLFVNPSGNDFKLKADSRAVDAGANVSAVTTDVSGVARPQGRIHDIGAYEFSGQPAASGPPAPPTGVRIVSN